MKNFHTIDDNPKLGLSDDFFPKFDSIQCCLSLIEFGILLDYGDQPCIICNNRGVRLVETYSSVSKIDPIQWRCENVGCKKRWSIRKGSFLAHDFRYPLYMLARVLFHLLNCEQTQKRTAELCGVSRKLINNLSKKLGILASKYNTLHPPSLGSHLQYDEFLLGKDTFYVTTRERSAKHVHTKKQEVGERIMAEGDSRKGNFGVFMSWIRIVGR